MDDKQIREYLEARWEAGLAELARISPATAEHLRNAPPPTEEEKAVVAAALRPRPMRKVKPDLKEPRWMIRDAKPGPEEVK